VYQSKSLNDQKDLLPFDAELDPERVKRITDENGQELPLGYWFTANSPEYTGDLPVTILSCIVVGNPLPSWDGNEHLFPCEYGDAYTRSQFFLRVQQFFGDDLKYNIREYRNTHFIPQSGIVPVLPGAIGGETVDYVGYGFDGLYTTRFSATYNERFGAVSDSRIVGRQIIIGIQPYGGEQPVILEHNAKLKKVQKAIETGTPPNASDVTLNPAWLWLPEEVLPSTVVKAKN
jgi:peptidoglycan hydrolase-like protein with peptidoglycan-binding domain